jgi:hypothetical protein
MKLSDEEFAFHADLMLKALGLKFQGIRLRCRNCGELAMAANVSLAQTFGWVKLRPKSGPDYEGFCLTCAKTMPE